MKTISILVIITLFLGTGIGFGASDDSGKTSEQTGGTSPAIKWMPYKEGAERSKVQQKKVFLHFYAEWCKFCTDMANSTFKNDSVVAYLNDNFIPIRVNSDKERRLAQNYNVAGLPMTWFIAETGENIGGIPGYISTEMMISLLKYVHTDSYKKMDFQKFMQTK